MSDHPTPATPEATEREARELFQTANAIAMSRARLGLPTLEQSRAVYAALDAYRAAVAAVESERGRRAEREARGGQHAAYTFAPADPALALALDSAEKLAREADEKFCAAFGGDGETSAYWLGEAVRAIRVALHRQTTEERA